jgi:hypothetical protein
MRAFALVVVTVGLIVAIPVANAQTGAPSDAGKSRHHAASHSKRPHFGMPLQTMLRRLLWPSASTPHVARHSVPLPLAKPMEVAAGPAEPAAPTKTADAASGPSSKSTGTVGEANRPTPQIQPTQDMPAVQGLE